MFKKLDSQKVAIVVFGLLFILFFIGYKYQSAAISWIVGLSVILIVLSAFVFALVKRYQDNEE